jgi:lysophospholipase L1-like esterase
MLQFAVSLALLMQGGTPATFELQGNWAIRIIQPGRAPAILSIQPPVTQSVLNEAYSAIPVFNPKAGGWVRGAQLKGVRAQETTSPNLLDPDSFKLTAGAADLVRGVDYEVDLAWGTFGRLEGGSIRPDQTVFASYRYTPPRIDAVMIDTAGKIILRQGEPRAAAPMAPSIGPGEKHLGNIYLPGPIQKLTQDHVFPILEIKFPEAKQKKHPVIRRLITKLNSGGSIRILAWGDSVTDGSYLANPSAERWQEQFVARLRSRFPKARIELLTEAWGGRNTGSYLAEPPGSPRNYQEKVLALKPDLVISEFVNDAGLKPDQVEQRYSKLLKDFEAIGAQWIILTPHYVRPDWMNLTRENNIDEDPRPYVKALRQFSASHGVPLADASLRYGRLWRQGIPYNTLMLNAINHPNSKGMSIFADALMALFR